MSATTAWLEIPEHLREPLGRFLVHGLHPGDFLKAVISNNLKQAVASGNDASLAGLRPLVMFMLNHAPAYAFGYSGAYQIWVGMTQSERLSLVTQCEAFPQMLADSGIPVGVEAA